MKKSMSALFIVAALALTSACGGDDGGDRPSKAEVKKSITSKDSALGTVPDKAADCVAGLLVDSKVSDGALKAIVDQDKKYKASKKDEKALQELQTDLGTCVTK